MGTSAKGAGGEVVEVTLSWGGGGGEPASVLLTAHLQPGEHFTVGEAPACDALIPAEVLGASEVEIVAYDVAGASVLPPAGSRVWIDALPADAAAVLPLSVGRVIDVEIGAFAIRARLLAAEDYATSFGPRMKAEDTFGFALSALVHGACLAALAFFLPALGPNDDAEISRDQLLTVRHLLDASAEHEREAQVQAGVSSSDEPEDHGASGGGRALGKGGAMGSEHAPKIPGHWSAAGDAPRESQALSRNDQIAMARDFGMVGLLATINSDPNAPTVPWGETLRGADRESHLGALFGPEAADSWGIGGLGLSGLDEGGDGNTLGVGINEVGNLSQSLDRRVGSGDPGGWGHGCGGKPCGLMHTHTVGAGLRMPREITTNGHLPPEIIQRIVRQNMGRFRSCYEGGLRTNPALEGRVAVRFIIDRQGAVSIAQDAGGQSDLPSDAVKSCIVKSFYSLSFPAPTDGTVTVTYPIVLTPAS